MKRLELAAICLIGILPSLGRGQDASTQPSNPAGAMDTPPFDRFNGRLRGYGFNRMGYGRLRGDAPTQAEWEDISAFMKEHSPERFKTLSNLPEGPRRMALVALAARNFRNLQRARIDQPEIAQVMIDRIELEDQVFKLANQIKSEKAHADAQAPADEKTLKQKIGELIDTNIKERQLRISRLEKTLQTEQDQLAQDTKNRDQLVDRRMHAFMDGPRPQPNPQEARDQTDSAVPTTQP